MPLSFSNSRQQPVQVALYRLSCCSLTVSLSEEEKPLVSHSASLRGGCVPVWRQVLGALATAAALSGRLTDPVGLDSDHMTALKKLADMEVVGIRNPTIDLSQHSP